MEIRRSELQQEMFVVLDTQIYIDLPDDTKSKNIDDLDIVLKIYKNNEDDHLVRIYYEIKAKKTYPDKPGFVRKNG